MTPEEQLQQSIDEHNERARHMRQSVQNARRYAVQLQPSTPAQDMVSDLLAIIDSYEDGITWQTTCTNCARMWTENYKQDVQLQPLRKLARLVSAAFHGGQLTLQTATADALEEVETVVPNIRPAFSAQGLG